MKVCILEKKLDMHYFQKEITIRPPYNVTVDRLMNQLYIRLTTKIPNVAHYNISKLKAFYVQNNTIFEVKMLWNENVVQTFTNKEKPKTNRAEEEFYEVFQAVLKQKIPHHFSIFPYIPQFEPKRRSSYKRQ